MAAERDAMTARYNLPTQGLLCALIGLAAMMAGCAGASAAARAGARNGALLPDRARALIEHCPELACTTAEVPGCGFSEDVEAGGVTLRADIECARAGTATVCVERRTPVGGENQIVQNQRLEFQCSGDPLKCVVTGGNAMWPAPAQSASGSAQRGAVSCHAPRRAGPTPARHSVPGPDTA
jgi:hypothetical protein